MNLSNAELENLLKQHFGRDEFEPDEREIISSILSGRDVLAGLRRGFDPSACYRLPALVLDGLTLVVTRFRQIIDRGKNDLLPTTHINNSLKPEHLQKRIRAVSQGRYKLVYAGAEQFRNRAFLFAISRSPVSLLVIEDAHCISRWSHDFRPEYLDVGKSLLEIDPAPRILTLAGACTPRTQDEICYQLRIVGSERFTGDLSIPNLSLEVISAFPPEEKYTILSSIMQETQGSAIIYANSRRQTVEICEFLGGFGLEVAVYHAGLGQEKRRQAENMFVSGQVQVLVTTTTGSLPTRLDKSDVRYAIHFDMPDRLERYYEQISAAGRDGKPARCLLIYSASDRDFHRSIIERNSIPPAEFWRLHDVLQKYAEKPVKNGDTKPDMPSRKALNDWLYKYFESLPIDAKKKLDELRDEYINLEHVDRNPRSEDEYDEYLKGKHWKEFSAGILDRRRSCQVCQRKAEHLHHRYYSTLGGERPEDVVALCSMCHCFIHAQNRMTLEIFNASKSSEDSQPRLFRMPEPKPVSDNPVDPLLVLPYGQIELEAAIDGRKLHRALSEMENAGMLEILPDCHTRAQVRILISRDKLTAMAVDETGQLIVNWLLENSKSDPKGDIQVNFASLKTELLRRHDVLEEFFLELQHKDAISYRPSRREMALRLIDLDASRMEDIFEKLKGERYQSLRDMEEYIHARECRQIYLSDYLGGEMWERCGKCDNCRDKKLTDDDAVDVIALPQYARFAMELVHRSEGRLLKSELVKILAGMDQRTTRYDKWPEFGALSVFRADDVLRLLDLLIGQGFLREEGETHPPIDLTNKGLRALNDEFDEYEAESISALTENMKQLARPSEPPEENESEEYRALIAILRCAEKTDGQVGRSGMVKMLMGEESKRLAKYGFDHMDEYGCLADMPKKTILKLIDSMIERGCLTISSFFFPMIQLTELGRRRIERIR